MMTIENMLNMLENHMITSVELVETSLSLHEKYIDKNAIAVISPLALYEAKLCDEDRRKGILRGKLHGIPIVIKDNIFYRDGTPTTCNSYAFHDLIPPYDATLVKALKKEGAIILGKANLSEFAYFMSNDHMPSGYGSMYGQVKHPFDETIDPYGSSTGSAVAVKLGIVAASVGTETNGSLMAPAYQCQIVSMKPTIGMISRHGIIPISPVQDTAGPMAQTVKDCALLLDVLAEADSNDDMTINIPRPSSFSKDIDQKLASSIIGVLSIKSYPYNEVEMNMIKKTKERLASLGHKTIDLEVESMKLNNEETLLYEFKSAMNSFLSSISKSTSMKSLEDIIAFNKLHERRCLRYGQTILEASQQTSGQLNDLDYIDKRAKLLEEASIVDTLIQKHHLIAIVSPWWLGYAPIYGNPSICIPEGIFDGTPKAMVFIGKRYDDHTLLKLTHQYQQTVL